MREALRDAALDNDKKNAITDELQNYARKYLSFDAETMKYLTICAL
jgi:hypothetical protein